MVITILTNSIPFVLDFTMTEEQIIFCYWYEQLTGECVEKLCEKMEITVDYFLEEFVI
jgi:hypothetical protein